MYRIFFIADIGNLCYLCFYLEVYQSSYLFDNPTFCFVDFLGYIFALYIIDLGSYFIISLCLFAWI